MEVEPVKKQYDTIYPDDIILCSFPKIYRKCSEEINEEDLHIVIYELKKEHPIFLKEFTFNVTGTFPYSPLLGRILMRIKISRLIRTYNPTLKRSELNEGVAEYITEFIEPKFSLDDKEIINMIAEKLIGRLNHCS